MVTSVAGVFAPAFQLTRPDNWDQTNALAEWNTFSSIYDRYRVTGVAFTFTPDKPNDTSTATGYRPLYVITDFDDIAALPSKAAAIEYNRLKIFNLFRPFKYYTKVPKLVNSAANGVVSLSSGMMDIANPQNTGSIKMYAEALDTSDNYGTFTFTYYIKFSGRR